MMKRNKIAASLTLAGLLAVTVPSHAAGVEESGVADEVNACVAEVRERVDVSDAIRVRHDITAIERRTVGYTLKIRTSVYSRAENEAIRAYAATCIVNGDNKPLSFAMVKHS